MEEQTCYRETEYESMRKLMRTAREDSPTAALIAAALRSELTPRQAQLVTLYYVEQHNMREIGTMLGVNPSTVCRTLQAARKKLRRCLRYSSRTLLREEE